MIDTEKGLDADSDVPPGAFDIAVFDAYLSAHFSADQIHVAQETIGEIRPHVRNILAEARLYQRR